MKIKSFLARPFASYIYKGIRKGMTTAVADQENILKGLIKVGRVTEIGKESGLDKVGCRTRTSVGPAFTPLAGCCGGRSSGSCRWRSSAARRRRWCAAS